MEIDRFSQSHLTHFFRIWTNISKTVEFVWPVGNWTSLFCRNARIKEMCEADNSVLLYPAPDAQDIDDVVRERGTGDYNIVLLDGTWAQARGMYLQNQCLQQMKKVSARTYFSHLAERRRVEPSSRQFHFP